MQIVSRDARDNRSMSPAFTEIGLPHELLSSFIAPPGGKKQVLLGPGLRYPTAGAILLFLSQDVILPWVNEVTIWKVRNRGANNDTLDTAGQEAQSICLSTVCD